MTNRYRTVLVGLLAVSACRQVIGIEEAEVDPDLSRGGRGGAKSAVDGGEGGGRDEAGEQNLPEAGRSSGPGSAGEGAGGNIGEPASAGQPGAGAGPSL